MKSGFYACRTRERTLTCMRSPHRELPSRLDRLQVGPGQEAESGSTGRRESLSRHDHRDALDSDATHQRVRSDSSDLVHARGFHMALAAVICVLVVMIGEP